MAEQPPYVFIAVSKEESEATPPALSVVIPTYNRCESLLRVLHALGEQTVATSLYEVLVVSDGATDGTKEQCIALDVPYTFRFFEQPNQGPSAARNRGVREARGNLILFLDDDVVPHPALIAEHLRFHRRDPRAVVIGPLLPPPDMRLQPWVQWEEKMLLKQYADMERGRYAPTPRQFYTGNASVAREAVIFAGGFDSSFTRAEDIELAYRLRDEGLTFYFAPEAAGWHYARRSFASWLEIPRAYGRNDARMCLEQDRFWILDTVGREFHERHTYIRRLARFVVGHPVRVAFVTWLLVGVSRLAAHLPGERSERAVAHAYSTIFNLRYWQGLCDEMDALVFWQSVRHYDKRFASAQREKTLASSR